MIRNARPADLQRLWELDRICFEPGIAYSPADLRLFVGLAGAECLVAETGGELEGFALGYPDRSSRAHVVTLDVHPSARRRGLGSELLEGLLERLAAAGADRAVLEVDVRNSGAIAFYRGLGFRRSGRLRGYYGRGLDAYRMVRGATSTRSPAAPDGGEGASRDRRAVPGD
jgi:[ribosomal protein S18]-alanine N-acetyltransferase